MLRKSCILGSVQTLTPSGNIRAVFWAAGGQRSVASAGKGGQGTDKVVFLACSYQVVDAVEALQPHLMSVHGCWVCQHGSEICPSCMVVVLGEHHHDACHLTP